MISQLFGHLDCHLEECVCADDAKDKEASRLHSQSNSHSTELSKLRAGRECGRAYKVKDDKGKTCNRGRQFLRPVQTHTLDQPQSTGATQQSRKKMLRQQWNIQTSPPTPPSCPERQTATKTPTTLMSVSTLGLIAHSLRPSTTSPQEPLRTDKAPQTIQTGNSCSIFTSNRTKQKGTETEKSNQIEQEAAGRDRGKISRYERNLRDIRNLRESLDLECGNESNKTGFWNAAALTSED